MKFSILESRLVSVGLASIIGVGVIGIGSVAFAQEGDAPAPPAASAEGGRHAGGVHLRSLLGEAGVTKEEVAEGKEAGLTWGEIIDTYGDISADEAKANALAALEAKLAEAVANGRIEQEKADELLANAPARIDAFLASVPGENRPHLPAKVARFTLGTVAEVLGVEPLVIVEQLQAGETIADIAGDQTQAVIDALVAGASAKIDEAVAAGKLDAERAEAIKAELPAKAEQFVNTEHPGRAAIDRIRDRGGERQGLRGRIGERFGN